VCPETPLKGSKYCSKHRHYKAERASPPRVHQTRARAQVVDGASGEFELDEDSDDDDMPYLVEDDTSGEESDEEDG